MKRGDRITRYLSSEAIPVECVVVEVTEEVVKVTAPQWFREGEGEGPDAGQVWTYDRRTGAEIDEELGWGPKFGVTGSFIKVEGAKVEGACLTNAKS